MRNHQFATRVEQLAGKFDELMACPLMPAKEATSSKLFSSKGGIYVFYENDRPIYVGRSDNLKRRVRIHRMSDHMGATLAFKLAREQANTEGLDHSMAKNRKAKIAIPEFNTMFLNAKQRITGMSVRFVEVEDSILQMMLEAYVHLELETPYNDFDNH